jgi:hypothetical protein
MTPGGVYRPRIQGSRDRTASPASPASPRTVQPGSQESLASRRVPSTAEERPPEFRVMVRYSGNGLPLLPAKISAKIPPRSSRVGIRLHAVQHEPDTNPIRRADSRSNRAAQPPDASSSSAGGLAANFVRTSRKREC